MLIYTHTQDANDYTTGSIEIKKKRTKSWIGEKQTQNNIKRQTIE